MTGDPEHRHPVVDRRFAVILFLALIAVIARAQTFTNPVIGFDEQFYLLVGDRLLHGAMPYIDIFDRKPVGLFLIYAGARALGGDGFLQYKLVAFLFVVATAYLVYRVSRRHAGMVAALCAATLYILWLDFMEGEGGQSPVFYNLPMIAAATLVLKASCEGRLLRRGAFAMILVGLALQIKYSVVAEGIYFGCWLIALAWQSGWRRWRLLGAVTLWVGLALLPTMLAFVFYFVIGEAHAFVFANVFSAFAQARADFTTQIEGGAVMIGVLAIPALLAASGWRARSQIAAARGLDRFLLGWLATAIISVLLYRRLASPHYAMPILLPLCCIVARAIDSRHRLRWGAVAVGVVALIGGQAVLAFSEANKGGAREAAAVARAAHVAEGRCIYVYDGYPALYMLTGSCLPTRWPFPGHLATQEEARPAALGVDPTAEVRRILATHPAAIVDDRPRFASGNPVTRAWLERTLAAEYVLAACVRTGPARVRLVYRVRTDPRQRPACDDA